MKRHSAKTFISIVLGIAAGCLALCGLLTWYVDPFYQYHDTKPGLKPVTYGQMYQNLGEAKYRTYQALITGTSVTESFQASWFEDKYHVTALKVPYAGGCMSDFERLFQTAFDSGNEIKDVFAGIDLFTLDALPDAENINFDPYLISDNPLNKMQYLFNKEVLLNYTYLSIKAAENPDYVYDRDKEYVWSDKVTYGREVVRETYLKTRPAIRAAKDHDAGMKQVDFNIRRYERFVTEHPDTQFYFYITPYSILMWDYVMRNGSFEIEIDAMKHLCKTMLAHDNVHLYNFAINEDLITDLSHYKDYAHYSPAVNRYMFDCLDTAENKMTADDYEAEIDAFRTFAMQYDYDALLQE